MLIRLWRSSLFFLLLLLNNYPPFRERQESARHLVASWPQLGPGEFKKLVYDSTFTKLEKEMRFLNAKPGAFPGLGKQDFGGSREVPILRLLSGFRPLT